METKTKNGKYFSQLGSWAELIKVIFLLALFKILGIWAVIAGGLIIYFILPKFLKKNKAEKNS